MVDKLIKQQKYCIGLKRNIELYINYFQVSFFVCWLHIVQNQNQIKN
jgi:hypothetical protein